MNERSADDAWRPRWWLFGVFVVIAGVHVSSGWSTSDAIGLPVGLACTAVLVFVRRLPPWMTGEQLPRPWSRSWLRGRRNRLTLALIVAVPALAGIVVAFVDHPPRGAEILYATFVVTCALGVVVSVAVKWVRTVGSLRLLAEARTPLSTQTVTETGPFVTGTLTFTDGSPGYFTLSDCPPSVVSAIGRTGKLWVNSARPGAIVAGPPGGDDFARGKTTVDWSSLRAWTPPPQSNVHKRLRRRSITFWVVLVLAAAFQVTAFVALGGVLAWTLLVVMIFVVAVMGIRRLRLGFTTALLDAGMWTEVAAASSPEGWRSRSMRGWAVFPDGIRARFTITSCPPELAWQVAIRRRLWIAGESRAGAAVVGLPDGVTFAIADFAVKEREYRRQRARTRGSALGADGFRS